MNLKFFIVIHLLLFCISESLCLLCQEPLGDSATIIKTEKGLKGLQKASRLREDGICWQIGQSLHIKCRNTYVSPNSIKKTSKRSHEQFNSCEVETPGEGLRSKRARFSFNEHCFYCGVCINVSCKYVIHKVTLLTFQKDVLETCRLRKDKWGNAVQERIISVLDLPAAGAVYHSQCYKNFKNFKAGIPHAFEKHVKDWESYKHKPEESELDKRFQAFLKVIEFFQEKDEDFLTFETMCEKMKEYGVDPYKHRTLKKKLLETCKNVYITDFKRKQNYVLFNCDSEK